MWREIKKGFKKEDKKKDNTTKNEDKKKDNTTKVEDLEEIDSVQTNPTTSRTRSKNIKENDLVHSNPTMVFSVIGDSDNLVPRPWPKTVFQTALIDAAKSGGG